MNYKISSIRDVLNQSPFSRYISKAELISAINTASYYKSSLVSTIHHPKFSPSQRLVVGDLMFGYAYNKFKSTGIQTLNINMENTLPNSSLGKIILELPLLFGEKPIRYGVDDKLLPWAVQDLTLKNRIIKTPYVSNIEQLKKYITNLGFNFQEVEERTDEINKLLIDSTKKSNNLSDSTTIFYKKLLSLLFGDNFINLIIPRNSYIMGDFSTELNKELLTFDSTPEIIRKLFSSGVRGLNPALFTGMRISDDKILQFVIRYSLKRDNFVLDILNPRKSRGIARHIDISWSEIEKSLLNDGSTLLPKLVPVSYLKILAYIKSNIIHFGAEYQARESIEKYLGIDPKYDFRLTPEMQDGSSFIKIFRKDNPELSISPSLIELYILFGEKNNILFESLLYTLKHNKPYKLGF